MYREAVRGRANDFETSRKTEIKVHWLESPSTCGRITDSY